MLNQARLRVYPRLILVTVWVVMALNLVLREDLFIGYDYLIFYTGGKLFQSDAAQLYDPQALSDLSRQILPGAEIGVHNVYLNPPYYAALFTWITRIPYLPSLIGWLLLSAAALLGAFYLIANDLLPEGAAKSGLTFGQLTVIGFSLFPIVYGLQSGQNHAFSLFFLVLVVVFCKQGRWVEAGLASGLLIYKPQFVVIFLVIWLAWRKLKALAVFGAVLGCAVLIVYISHGVNPFLEYIETLQYVWLYPFDEVGKIEMSIYALFAPLFAAQNLNVLILASQGLGLAALALVFGLALRHQPTSWKSMVLPLLAGILFPFFYSPHVLFYDMGGLVVFFALWASLSSSNLFRWSAAITYLGSLFLPLVAVTAGAPILGIIPLGLAVCLAVDVYTSPRQLRV
jgi:hypothetical protein